MYICNHTFVYGDQKFRAGWSYETIPPTEFQYFDEVGTRMEVQVGDQEVETAAKRSKKK
jgi:hypothetical protein